MKNFLRIVLLLVLSTLLFSCGRSESDSEVIDPDKLLLSEEIANHDCDKHGHVFSKATCLKVSTCYYCGETKGDKAEHDKTKATCIKKSFCTVCGEEFGDFSDHKFTKASCAGASSCSVCGVTTGSALSHNWKGATCVSPSMCSGCMKKSGSPLGHIWTGGSCTEGKTCSRCSRKTEPLGHKMSEGSCTKDSVCSVCDYAVKAKGHDFENGKCTVCGKTQQQAVEESKKEEQNKTTEAPEITTEKLDTQPLLKKADEIYVLASDAHSLCQTAIDDIYGTGEEAALSAVEKLNSIMSIVNALNSECDADSRLDVLKPYLNSVKKTIEKYASIKEFNKSTILKTVVDMRAACTEAKTASEKLIKYLETL